MDDKINRYKYGAKHVGSVTCGSAKELTKSEKLGDKQITPDNGLGGEVRGEDNRPVKVDSVGDIVI